MLRRKFNKHYIRPFRYLYREWLERSLKKAFVKYLTLLHNIPFPANV